MIEFMELPFKKDALEPYISAKTIEFHYGKHHKAYVDKVNELIAGTEFDEMDLEEIIDALYGNADLAVLYNNAGQVYNHNVYWKSVNIWQRLEEDEKEAIMADLGGADNLKKTLQDKAVSVFGSGWVWLVKNAKGRYEVMTTKNGDTPLVLGLEPVFNIDVWEHAYYLDYQNLRKDYAEKFIFGVLKI